MHKQQKELMKLSRSFDLFIKSTLKKIIKLMKTNMMYLILFLCIVIKLCSKYG